MKFVFATATLNISLDRNPAPSRLFSSLHQVALAFHFI